MKLKVFEYYAPQNLSEALELLHRYGEKAVVLAGGTDLLVEMKQKKRAPECLINIRGIPEMEGITENEKELHIGAATALSKLEDSSLLHEKYSLLAQAAGSIGSLQVRNRATIGGNICHASPSADTAPPLLAMRASFRIVGPNGERLVPAEEFFLAPGKTVLGPDELLFAVSIPSGNGRASGVYIKHGVRKAMDLAIVGVAAVVRLDHHNDIFGQVEIGLGAVAPTPIRAKRAESLLLGQRPQGSLITEAAYVASQECKPISDIRSSAAYRAEMVRVLTKRALEQAVSQARAS